jgi:1-acyl-sn-glycerol-3-phosphate acyltransferase
MNRFIDLWRQPLPYLSTGNTWLLRMLMVPNLFLIKVEGAEQLEKNGAAPCIYAFNHNNAFESLFVPVMLIWLLGGRKVSFLIDWMYGRLPIVGWLMKRIDPVYVWHKRSTLPFIERTRLKEPSTGSRDECIQRLAEGASIGIFPEGTRNDDPFRLLRAKPGIGYIAIEAGVPVIPVGIEFVSTRRRKRVPVIGRLVLRIGEPMHFDVNTFSDAGNGKNLKRQIAGTIADEVMIAISALCGKSYPYKEHETKSILTLNQPMEALCPS